MKIFYVTKWILRSFLFLLLLGLIVESAVVVPNQKGYQDGTKLSEQPLLPETSPAPYVEEENHAPTLNQIFLKRFKRLASKWIPSPCNKARGIFGYKCVSSKLLADLRYLVTTPKNKWKQKCLTRLSEGCELISRPLRKQKMQKRITNLCNAGFCLIKENE